MPTGYIFIIDIICWHSYGQLIFLFTFTWIAGKYPNHPSIYLSTNSYLTGENLGKFITGNECFKTY